MESIVVSTELLYKQKKRYYSINSPYNVDFWKEVKKRWLVFGVLAAILLAVISPRTGAPGGLLRTEYSSYLPSSLIYFGAGARLAPSPGGGGGGYLPRLPLSLAATAALHAHVAAPALCVCAVTMFGDALHRPVVSGALLSSVGGGCAWLSLALSRCGAAALVAAACYLASLVATPLSVLLLCGRTSIPCVSDVLSTALATLVPFALGAALGRPLSGQRALDRAAALVLVYAECCTRLADAQGALYVGDVLATLMVEVLWVSASVCACAAYARWWGARGARLIALCAVPKALDAGWGSEAACGAGALRRLPGVFAAPAQALLLAAVHGHERHEQRGEGGDTHDWEND